MTQISGYEKKCDGDRFIPSRINFNLDLSYHLIHNNTKKHKDITDQDINDRSIQKYEDSVGKLIGCDYKSNRVLPFFKSQPANTRSRQQTEDSPWPVKPRKKPTVGAPHSILDLPNFLDLFQKNVLDWGRNNYIAAALWNSVYLWNAENSKIIRIASHDTSAIKWHPTNAELFIATPHTIKVWDLETAKVKYSLEIHCYNMKCTITAVDWHPFVDVRATGCSRGSLSLVGDTQCKVLKFMTPTASPILVVSFSPNGRYLACSSMSTYVNIWTFPDGVPYFRVRMSSSTRGMSWHPLKHSYLCLGDVRGVMTLLNVSKMTLVSNHHPPNYKPCSFPHASIYCLTFSEITGELVTSHYIHANEGRSTAPVAQVNVLSSFNKLVDRFELDPNDKVMYLKWNPDGTQIATAGSDESLQLWNFLPNGKGKKENKDERTEKLSQRGQVNFTNHLRFSIR